MGNEIKIYAIEGKRKYLEKNQELSVIYKDDNGYFWYSNMKGGRPLIFLNYNVARGEMNKVKMRTLDRKTLKIKRYKADLIK